MRIAFLVILLAHVPAWAQPGRPRPLGPRRGETTTTAPTAAPQYVVDTVDYLSSTKLTVKRQPDSSPQPVTNMDFTVDEKSRVAQGLKSQDRVVVVFEVAGGSTLYRAALVMRPEGADAEKVIQGR